MQATFANIVILVSIGENSFEGGCAGGGDYDSWYGGG